MYSLVLFWDSSEGGKMRKHKREREQYYGYSWKNPYCGLQSPDKTLSN